MKQIYNKASEIRYWNWIHSTIIINKISTVPWIIRKSLIGIIQKY